MTIGFEFVGGPQDGKLVSGQLGEGCDAERHYLFTSHGTVGFLFKVASDFAIETLAHEGLNSNKRHNFQKHFYVVADRLEADGEVYVRAECVPNAINAGEVRPSVR